MAKRRNRLWLAVASILGTLIVLTAAGLILIYMGVYNVAASAKHTSVEHWTIETAMENSVRRRAAGLAPPAPLTAADLAAGASHYRDVCQHCHGGPGVRRDEWAEGLNPSPPDLSEEAAEWSSGELFWIVKHGIRMTGMPAIGAGHSDRDIWNIVAFVERLPRMSPAEYRAATPRPGGREEETQGHGPPGHAH